MYEEGIHTAIFDCEVRKRSKRLGNTGNRSNRTVPYRIWLNRGLLTGCYHASPYTAVQSLKLNALSVFPSAQASLPAIFAVRSSQPWRSIPVASNSS